MTHDHAGKPHAGLALVLVSLTLAVVLALGGCARLDIRVDMYNPELAGPAPSLLSSVSLATKAGRELLAAYDSPNTEGESTLARSLENSARLAVAEVLASPTWAIRVSKEDSDVIRQRLPELPDSLPRAIERLRYIDAVVNEADEAMINKPQSYGLRPSLLYRDAREQIIGASVELAQWRTARDDLERLLPLFGIAVAGFPPEPLPAVRKFLDSTASLTKRVEEAERASAPSLASDADLYHVIHSPEQAWSKQYNRAFGRGDVGNTDIAIIASGDYRQGGNSVPSFSVKGVRLDASNVTRATFAALKDTLRVAAAAAGVPLPTAAFAPTPARGQAQGDPGSAGLAAERINQQIAAARVNQVRDENARRLSRSALLGLLDAIALNESNMSSSDPSVRRAAAKNIVSSFEAYKDALVPPAPAP